MKYVLLLCALFALTVTVCSASEPNAVRNKISHDSTIQGFPCARGAAWFYPDGSLNQCTLSRPAAIGDLRVPRGSVVEFWPSGTAHLLMLPHAGLLAGYRVRGGTRFGLSRGATTAFYRSGELRSFYLVGNQTIQGVPCRGGSWNTLTDPTGSETEVELYPDGKIQSCKLSQNFSGFHAGERIVIPHLTSVAAATTTAAAASEWARTDPSR